MPAKRKKSIVSKFPLRLMPSVRQDAENFSETEVCTLRNGAIA
jgi:hypothetical protein